MLRVILIIAAFIPYYTWSSGLGINATRLIYPEGATSIQAQVSNTLQSSPYLVQVTASRKQNAVTQSPFNVTPPLFRLESGSVTNIRIAYNGDPLPENRESVFYLHSVGIQGSGAESSKLSETNINIGVGNVIKIFYRPEGLKGSAMLAQEGLEFIRYKDRLLVKNPSAYFVSLNSLQVDSKRLELKKPEQLMLSPGGNAIWIVSTSLVSGSIVKWTTINDFGGINEHQKVLQ